MRRVLSAGSLAALASALLFAPLAFGAVEPWAYSLLAVLAYAALLPALGYAIFVGRASRLRMPMLLPAALALLLVWAQYVRWPAPALEAISPVSASMQRQAALWAGGGTGTAALPPSLYRHATRDALVCLSAYVALFLATCLYVRRRRHISRLAGVIVAVGFCVSLLAIVQSLSGARAIYWWRKPTHGGALFGPFVSRNQFASYAGVCMFAGVGLLLGLSARGSSAAGWSGGLRWMLTAGAHRSFVVVFAVAVTGAAVFWSLSRGGVLALLLAFAGVVLTLGLSGFGRRRMLAAVGAFAAALGLVSYLGWGPLAGRFARLAQMAREPSASWRLRMCADALRMGRDFPLVGAGAGTFLSVYPHYRSIPTDAVTRSPHNEYVHVFAETGLAGVCILALAMVMFYGRLLRALAVRRDPYVRGFVAAGLGAPVMVSLHSMIDFPMRSPAVAATLAVVCGLLYRAAVLRAHRRAGSHTSRQLQSAGRAGAEGGSSAGGDASAASSPWRLAAVGALACAFVPLWNFALNPLRGELEANRIRRTLARVGPGSGNVAAFVELTERAIRSHSPDDAGLYSALARFARAAASRTEHVLERVALAQQAIALTRTAGRAEPMNADHPFDLAMDYLSFRRPDLAMVQAERACSLLPGDPWIRAYLADGFLGNGYPEAARNYLRRARVLAGRRGIEAVLPLIERVRRRLEAAGAGRGDET